MESEKVKEIKKALECCKQNEIEDTCEYCHDCPASDWDYEKECNIDLFQKALTLINELESENEKLKQHKRELQGGQQDLTKRIAELEKENAKLLDSVETVQSNRCVYKCVLTKEHLIKFAERLKEKAIRRQEFIGELAIDDIEYVKTQDIDETLKECLCEK